MQVVLEPLSSFSMSLHDEIGQKQDIRNYIWEIVHTDQNMRGWIAEDKELVINTLSERANGMSGSFLCALPHYSHYLSCRFRWVSCQVEILRAALPQTVRHILDGLPKTMDETYERMLMKINMTMRKYVLRLLQCLTAAIRPLRVEELAVILAMDFDAGEGVPTLNLDWRWEDYKRAVLSACSSLVDVIIFADGSRVVQFSHPSVKDFLTSKRLATSSERASFYYILYESAHKTLAQACLGTLLRLDDQNDKDGTKDLALAEYAAQYWVDHAHSGNVALLDGMKLLFDAEKPHFSAWISVHDIVNPLEFSTSGPVPSRGTPLYYATLCDLYDLVEHLLLYKDPNGIDAEGGRYTTAIHAALY